VRPQSTKRSEFGNLVRTVWGAYLKWTSRAQAADAKSGSGADYYNRRRTKHNGTAKAGSGTVTIIGGSDTPYTYYPCGTSSCPTTVWNTGGVDITVNGFLASVSYGQNSDKQFSGEFSGVGP